MNLSEEIKDEILRLLSNELTVIGRDEDGKRTIKREIEGTTIILSDSFWFSDTRMNLAFDRLLPIYPKPAKLLCEAIEKIRLVKDIKHFKLVVTWLNNFDITSEDRDLSKQDLPYEIIVEFLSLIENELKITVIKDEKGGIILEKTFLESVLIRTKISSRDYLNDTESLIPIGMRDREIYPKSSFKKFCDVIAIIKRLPNNHIALIKDWLRSYIESYGITI